MRTFAAVVVLAALAGETFREEVLFRDEFRGKLAAGWIWIREDPAGWRVTEEGLEIRLEPGNMWGPANNARNVLVRPVPDPAQQPLDISVTVANRPTEQYEQVDLVWYYDDSHQVKIGQELVDKKLSLVMGREERDRTRTLAVLPIAGESVRVRFLVSGDRIRGRYRPEGEEAWKEAGECTLPVHGDPKISLQVYQGPAREERWGRFRDFLILRGSP